MATTTHKKSGSDLEHEVRSLRASINETREQQGRDTNELMSLLAAQAGQVTARQPLAQENEQAQAGLQEARGALARHLGSPNESGFAQKLHQAEEIANKAATALADFDKQAAPNKNRIQELRTTISQQTEQLQTMQAQCQGLDEQLLQVRAAERQAALIKLLSAYSDLYDVMQDVGPALASMRVDEPAAFNKLFEDLEIDQQQLWNLLLPSFRSSDLSDYWRPFLLQRQAMIKTRLAALSKKK